MIHLVSRDELEESLGLGLPPDLADFYDERDGWYREDGEWWVVWPRTRVASENQAAWKSGDLPRDLLAFGDDGTGDPFCMSLTGSGEVVRWSWIDNAVESTFGPWGVFMAEWMSPPT